MDTMQYKQKRTSPIGKYGTILICIYKGANRVKLYKMCLKLYFSFPSCQ